MAGVSCDGVEVGSISAEGINPDEPWVCEKCGATLRLKWDVRLVEASESPTSPSVAPEQDFDAMLDELEQLVADRTFVSGRATTVARQARANRLAAASRTAIRSYVTQLREERNALELQLRDREGYTAELSDTVAGQRDELFKRLGIIKRLQAELASLRSPTKGK